MLYWDKTFPSGKSVFSLCNISPCNNVFLLMFLCILSCGSSHLKQLRRKIWDMTPEFPSFRVDSGLASKPSDGTRKQEFKIGKLIQNKTCHYFVFSYYFPSCSVLTLDALAMLCGNCCMKKKSMKTAGKCKPLKRMKTEKSLLWDWLGVPGRLILDDLWWTGPLDNVQTCPWSVCCYSSCWWCNCGEDSPSFAGLTFLW